MSSSRQTLKKVIDEWQEKNQVSILDAPEIKLNFMNPPLDRLDPMVLSTLVNCQKLSLSTNAIIAMVPFNESLQILALSRNQIRKIVGLDEVGATLKQLWLSYNNIDSLSGLGACTVLEIFYIGHNRIRDWAEVDKLKDLKNLQTTVLLGNEIHEKAMAEGKEADYRMTICKRLPQILMLDGLTTHPERTKLQSMDEAGES